MTEEEIEEMEAKAKSEVDQAVEAAREAPYPKGEEAAKPVCAQEVNNG